MKPRAPRSRLEDEFLRPPQAGGHDPAPAVFAVCFGSDAGRNVLDWLKTYCYATRPVAVLDPAGRVDPYAAAFYDGRRSVLLAILARLEIARRGLTPPRQAASDTVRKETP